MSESDGSQEQLDLQSPYPLDTRIVLKRLQSIEEQLAQLIVALRQSSSNSSASIQQSTAQATQSEKTTNEQAGQPRNSEFEQYRDLARLVYEQARDYTKLLQEQSSIQVNLNTTVANQITSMAEQLKKLMGDQLNPPSETAMPLNVTPQDSSDVKGDEKESSSGHITCLVALPSEENDGNFQTVVLPALRQVLELDPFYWQVVCEDEKFFESLEQLNVLAWLKHAQAYIADISSGNFKVMIELGAMLSARKPNQPLLVLKREESTHNFTGILGRIIGMHIQYPSTNTSTSHDIDRVAEALRKQILKHGDDKSELNTKKKAHYLSSLLLIKECKLEKDTAESLSRAFITMQAAVKADQAGTFQSLASSAGLPLHMVNGVKEFITKKLNQLVDNTEGGKHDEQPPKPSQ